MSEAYMKQYTPGLKYVMNAQLPISKFSFASIQMTWVAESAASSTSPVA